MINRYQAADVTQFAQACEYGFVVDHQGDIQYAVTIQIDGDRYGCVFVVPGEGDYSEDRVAEGIGMLWQSLIADGVIGHGERRDAKTVTLTGNPMGDLIQVGAELVRLPATVH